MPGAKWWSEQINTLGFPVVVCIAMGWAMWTIGMRAFDGYSTYLSTQSKVMVEQIEELRTHRAALDGIRESQTMIRNEQRECFGKLIESDQAKEKALQEMIAEQKHTTDAVLSLKKELP